MSTPPCNSAVKHLREAIKHLTEEQLDLLQSRAEFVSFSGERPESILPDIAHEGLDRPLCLVGDGTVSLRKAVRDIIKTNDLEFAVDEGFLSDQLLPILHEAHFRNTKDDKLTARVRQLVDRVRQDFVEATVYLPIVNMQFNGVETLNVGNVVFRATEAALPEMVACLNECPNMADYASVVDHILARVGQHRAVASILLRVHESVLYSRAILEIKQALCLLRCYQRLANQRGWRAYLGIVGDIVPLTQNTMFAAHHSGASHMSARTVAEGSMRPFEIDTALADAMSSDGSFRALQRIITKSHKERTALEDQILLSVNWSGAAICETANHVEFLHHCVALECLLLRPHEDEQLTKTFSERLAYLIGRTREACQRVEKKAKRFYGLRSNIVHKALTDVSDDDVNVMAYYALQAIISMANRTDRWRSIEDFIEWANGVKYDAVTAATLPADA